MTVRIEFNIDNAGFDRADGYDIAAVAATIHEVADEIEDSVSGSVNREGCHQLTLHKNIRDSNGNIVGTYAIKDHEWL